MQARALVADLEDELVRPVVDEWARVVDVAGEAGGRGCCCGGGGVWWGRDGGVTDDGDPGLADVFQTQGYFVPVAGEVEGYGVADELLLEAFEVEIAAVAQELGAVGFVFDVEGVAAKEVKELGEGVGRAVGY
jgi:hypothetical protein